MGMFLEKLRYDSQVNFMSNLSLIAASIDCSICIQGDGNGSRAIIMNILNSYLLSNPSGSRQMAQKRGKRKETAQYQFFNNEYKRRSASLVDIYSTRLKELTEESTEERRDGKWKKTVGREEHSLVVENGHRVEKTINSVNQYAEQLRVTLINQYKSHKIQSLRSRRPQQHQESMSPRLQLQTISPNHQAQKQTESLTFKQGQKSPAYKTLNLLYQAIIDNSFQKRRKDDFELQAIRLPIVDRFNPYAQASKSDYEPQMTFRPDNTKRIALSLPQHKIDSSAKTKTLENRFSKRPSLPRRRSNRLHQQQQGEIIPWKTEEQGYYD